ncbi:MAG TPA: HAMP domain-containing sensor histidine kinase [Candidatus Wallbacteria bacterium]|nr:HAMP domain-containing sensor histidine kinase [Candidatus Wallbacteria bacterium]
MMKPRPDGKGPDMMQPPPDGKYPDKISGKTDEIKVSKLNSSSEVGISKKEDEGQNKRSGRRMPHEEFVSRVLDEIPKDQKAGRYEAEHCTYTILDTIEATNVLTRDILSSGGFYMRESEECMVFFRKITQKDSREVNVIIEMGMRNGPERDFIGIIYARKLIIFSLVLIIAGIAIFFIFVSYRHSVEAQNENQKYQAVKRMSHGLAHEIRNPLNAMHLSLEVLKCNVEDPEGVKKGENEECVAIIDSEIKRLDELVKKFMEYSKEIKIKRAKTSLNKLINSAVLVLTPIASEKNITIGIKSEREIEADIDSELIYRCFINVIKNAVEAANVGGIVEILCGKTSAGAEFVITDNGEGVKPENMPKIFDFYFSTKKEGSGIGLALTKKFVEAHNGSINATSVAGKTSFVIKLPV